MLGNLSFSARRRAAHPPQDVAPFSGVGGFQNRRRRSHRAFRPVVVVAHGADARRYVPPVGVGPRLRALGSLAVSARHVMVTVIVWEQVSV